MMRAGIQTEQLTIKHVRDRGERVPVLRMHVREGPDHAIPVQTRNDVRIIYDVTRIVEVDELMANGLPKNRPRQRYDSGADAEL